MSLDLEAKLGHDTSRDVTNPGGVIAHSFRVLLNNIVIYIRTGVTTFRRKI